MGGSYAEIREEGREEGLTEGMLRSLRKLIVKGGMTLEQAMSLLDVPEEERAEYRKELGA